MPSPTPAATIQHFSRLLSEARLDVLLEMYEEDAVFAPEPGVAVQGRRAIRSALQRLLDMKPRMSGSVQKVLEGPHTALVSYRWELEGTGPDGDPVRLEGTSSDVLRRRPDGSWGVLIDDPWGAAASPAA
jgi:ketosteroid isomerase-like protein